MIAGRTCPIDYHLSAEDFEEVKLNDQPMLVVGGLYGNRFSLDELKAIQKSLSAKMILNGDVHWFDKDYEDFLYVEEKISDDLKIVGNVECELRRNDDIGAGCGCAYPSFASDASVERSNQIHKELKTMFVGHKDLKAFLKDRPKAFIIENYGLRFLIIHGDEKSVAGWDNDKSRLVDEDRQIELKDFCQKKNIDAVLCTHTCSQVIFEWEDHVLVNNGASGMNSVKGGGNGLYTKISKEKSAHAIYSKEITGVFIELMPLHYDKAPMVEWFDQVWPKDSPAEISYRDRIVNGVSDDLLVIKSK
uniref:hypothetical protein n=1 Tax=Ezakiella massiliensis TaxID=1852374 RepID=UPI00094E064D|nr:hypothetical protein [Ezakiella massiliensis]